MSVNQDSLYKYVVKILRQLNIPFVDPCDTNYEGDCICGSGSTLPSFTEGSVIFSDSSGNLDEDNLNLYWDNTNKQLGIGKVPTVTLDIVGSSKFEGTTVFMGPTSFLTEGSFGVSFLGSSFFNMLRLDPSTNFVGIGNPLPTEQLDVIGKVKISDRSNTAVTISGFDVDGVLSDITLGSGIALNAGVLDVSGGNTIFNSDGTSTDSVRTFDIDGEFILNNSTDFTSIRFDLNTPSAAGIYFSNDFFNDGASIRSASAGNLELNGLVNTIINYGSSLGIQGNSTLATNLSLGATGYYITANSLDDYVLRLGTGNGIEIDANATLDKTGIQYIGFGESFPGATDGDYSQLFPNSLVPKQYVDNAITGVASIYTADGNTGASLRSVTVSNGLYFVDPNYSDNYIKVLTDYDVGDSSPNGSTAIVGFYFFDEEDNSGAPGFVGLGEDGMEVGSENGNTIISGMDVKIRGNDLNLSGSNIFIQDFGFGGSKGVRLKGFSESDNNDTGGTADYSSLVNTSLVPKRYVDDFGLFKGVTDFQLDNDGFEEIGLRLKSGDLEYTSVFTPDDELLINRVYNTVTNYRSEISITDNRIVLTNEDSTGEFAMIRMSDGETTYRSSDGKGIKYTNFGGVDNDDSTGVADYSTLVNTSLVPKKYVDNETSSVSKITNVASTNYTVLVDDYLIQVDTITGGGNTITLPLSPNTRKKFIIKDASGTAATNNITIDTTGIPTIDGAASIVLNQNYDSYTIYFDGANYHII